MLWHEAFLEQAKSDWKTYEAIQEQLRMSSQPLRSSVKNLLPLAEEIEKLAPALAQDGPNAEYPWVDPSGTIRVPASFQFSTAYKLVDPAGRKLLQLTRLLLDRFYILFIPKRTK